MIQFGKWVGALSVLQLGLISFAFVGLLWFLISRSQRLRPYTGQLVVLGAIAWVAAVFYVVTYSFPVPRGALASNADAATVPRLWVILLVPFLLLVLQQILSRQEEPDRPFGQLRLNGVILGTLVISLLLFEWIGYYLSSALFILACMLLLQQRNRVILVAVPIGWVAFTYAIFARLLFLPLPVGKLFSLLLR